MTLDEIQEKELKDQKAFEKWIDSPDFLLGSRIDRDSREALTFYVRALHYEIADLKAEILRLKGDL